MVSTAPAVSLISIEATNRCSKACAFCYNASGPSRATEWNAEDLVAFVRDCAAEGVRAVSWGGGEPLEFDEIEAVVRALKGTLYQSMTTNGLLLDEATCGRLAAAGLSKVHVSIHFPERHEEVERAIDRVRMVDASGMKAGINLVVSAPAIDAATAAARELNRAGIANDRIVHLPMRGRDTPTPRQVGAVAGSSAFQSMTCLGGCARSPRFASISWDRTVAWCSYTRSRRRLAEPTHAALLDCLEGLGLEYCGDAPRVERRGAPRGDVASMVARE